MRFLLSRRWAIFFLVIVLAAWGAWALGRWQFHRLTEREASNHRTAVNLAALPVPIDALMKVGQEPSGADTWRRVTVHGTYDNRGTVVVKYQTRGGGAGVDVVTPLRTASGAAVLVDRGWMPSVNSGNVQIKVPPATPGLVTVTGFVRRDATGGATSMGGMATRAISSVSIAKVLSYPLYGGWLDLAAQAPLPTTPLGGSELPNDTSDGPHFFYGLQWWFFGILAVFGFFFLMYDERKRIREDREAAARSAERAPTSV